MIFINLADIFGGTIVILDKLISEEDFDEMQF